MLCMRKRKLILSNEIEDTIFGIVSSLKEFKLAWKINNALNIDLVKQSDLNLSFVDGSDLVISNYEYCTEFISFRLLQNRSINDLGKYLIPELARFDFFIMIDQPDLIMDGRYLIDILKEVNGIEFAMTVSTEKLKNKDNFIF